MTIPRLTAVARKVRLGATHQARRLTMYRLLDPDFIARHFDWDGWQALLERRGVVVERAHRTPHPLFPEIVYPIDYGYVPHTDGGDGGAVDVFIGTYPSGLTGLIATVDHRRRDREVKLLWNCSPEEIYLVNGFINFDRRLMEGVLVLRHPLHELWLSC